MWKSRPIVGRATLTIVMSMMFMNIADDEDDADDDLLVEARYDHGGSLSCTAGERRPARRSASSTAGFLL